MQEGYIKTRGKGLPHQLGRVGFGRVTTVSFKGDSPRERLDLSEKIKFRDVFISFFLIGLFYVL